MMGEMGERGNAIVMYACPCVCVYVCMYVTKSARCAVAASMVAQLLFLVLVSLSVKVLRCNVTLTYLFSAEVIQSMKIAFFSVCFVNLCENRPTYQNFFSIDSY